MHAININTGSIDIEYIQAHYDAVWHIETCSTISTV